MRISSVSAGAVTAIHSLTQELDLAGRINRAISPDRDVQVRDTWTVGQSLVAAMIARACAPRSKRAFADGAKTTHLPDLMHCTPSALTSQHFRDQRNAVPVEKRALVEPELVREVVRIEPLQLRALAYDTTNFYTHMASANLRPKLPPRGTNKPGRHDLRQMGLALVVDQVTQLPLAHVLYEGARSDRKTFAEFLKPVRKRLRELTGQPEQLTLVVDAGASSRQNLAGLERYVTAVRPSDHLALLSEAAGHVSCVPHLAEVQLSNGAAVRAWRTQRKVAGKQRDVVVVFSPQLDAGQLRGLRQTGSRSGREWEEMQWHPSVSVEAAQRRLDKIRGHQYLRSPLCYEMTRDGQGPIRIRLWSDGQEDQRLITRYFGLRIPITDRAEWSTAQIIEADRGQSKVETAFRDWKDPHMLSTRPPFHWTDPKLHVHACMCVTAYLLVTLLPLRAKQKTAFEGGPRRLLAEWAEVRCCRLIDRPGHKGRPHVRGQVEEFDQVRRPLVEALHALPAIG